MKEDTNYHIHTRAPQTCKIHDCLRENRSTKTWILKSKYWEFLVGYVNQRTPTKIIAIK
jgi:hypothetical protein